MYFSGKITNSVVTFLRNQGTEFAEVYESTDLPIEFLSDPTCWLDARKVENLLQSFEDLCVQKLGLESPLRHIGHAAKELKAWGVLDSVLRMIEKPNEIFLQPQRFISYFISPAPPIANIKRGENMVAFDLPISFEEFPRTVTYLCAAIEAVPLFMGAQMADASWRQNSVVISWSQTQPLLDANAMGGRHMAPEVMRNLISTLEKTEQALIEKTHELEKIKNENALAAQSVVPQLDEFKEFRQQYAAFQQKILRLQDYFTRSQQLITLLVGQDRMNSQVREAMKRVNWTQVQEAFPKLTQEILDTLENKPSSQQASLESDYAENYESPRAGDSGQPWLPHN